MFFVVDRFMNTGMERFLRHNAIMNDPKLKAEYLNKIRAKIADEMVEEEKKFFSELPTCATHYLTWEYGYKSFYKNVDGTWYVWVGGEKWHEFDLFNYPLYEIPEQYLK